MIIGKRIKDMRIQKGLSQQQLGDMLGVTKVSICGYENGTRTPSLEIFELLLDKFHVSADYLLGREINVINEEDNMYVGSCAKEEINAIHEFRHYTNLHSKIIRDPKRYISLINKKMR